MRPSARRRWLAIPFAAFVATCAEKATGPAAVAAIEVTSNIGLRLAAGRTATLTATARDASGFSLTNTVFTWTSSQPAIASVSASGVVTGIATGPTTITVTGGGVSATINFLVSTPNFTGITATIGDPLTTSLSGGLSTISRTRTQTALALCTTGITTGDFTVIESCISGVRTEVTAATEATDIALLATLGLLIDHVDRLLKL
jgi:hypothetical protein